MYDLSLLGSKGTVAGIGSRRLPVYESLFLFKSTFVLTLMGYKFSSGSADGADTSVERAVIAAVELGLSLNGLDKSLVPNYLAKCLASYLPWEGFNGRRSSPGYVTYIPEEAEAITGPYHPAFEKLKDSVKSMMSRNACQILGNELKPESYAKFVLCYTPDAALTAADTSSSSGGTGQAIRIADDYQVPLFNIKNEEHRARIQKFIDDKVIEFKSQYGVDIDAYMDNYYFNYRGVKNKLTANVNSVFDALVHDVVLVQDVSCNPANRSPIMKAYFSKFPAAEIADKAFLPKGKGRLGKYAVAETIVDNKKITLVTAYTQVDSLSGSPEILTDYEAVRAVLEDIGKKFIGSKMVLSKIGAEGNGCWLTVANRMNTDLRKIDFTVIEHDGSPLEMQPNRHWKNLEGREFSHNDFVFFHGKQDVFSQWHPSVFIAEGIKFYSGEQYMMYKKAELFQADAAMNKLRYEKDPRECKRIGREEIPGYNDSVWKANDKKIVFQGNVFKFTQNPQMLSLLLAGSSKIFVEASKTDRVWGIGMDVTHKDILNPAKWRGENKLGKALNAVADYILENHLTMDLPNSSRKVIDNHLLEAAENNKIDLSRSDVAQIGLLGM